MVRTNITVDGILTLAVAAACVLMGGGNAVAAVSSGGAGADVVVTGAFCASSLVAVAALLAERWRLPLLIAVHWLVVLGLGAALPGAGPLAILPFTAAAILFVGHRRMNEWEAEEDRQDVGIAAPADPVIDTAPAKASPGPRERIEPRFD